MGTGYVGLTTGACFAHLGHEVVCADIDPAKVEALERGEIPIHEPGLEDLVAEGVAAGRLRFVLGGAAAVPDCDVAYLCVPTPQGIDGAPDLTYLEAAAREIGPLLPSEAVVVNKSTVPVGSARVVEQHLGRTDVAVASNPEFLREGSAVQDFLHPDRVVIGAQDREAAIKVADLFDGISAPVLVTDPASAETIKYVSNAFLATKLSFVNAVASVCESVGADVEDVLLGMGYDTRIGAEFLRPGPGWGGSCFPKDTRALLRIAEDAGYDFSLLESVLEANAAQFDRTANRIWALAGSEPTPPTVAVWGLTFKANTDDLRDSPSIEVIRRLTQRGALVRAYDPVLAPEAIDLEGVTMVDDAYAACEGADVVAVLTEWDEFKFVDVDKMANVLAQRKIFDGRNILDRSQFTPHGFTLEGIGRR
ncbi:MAG: UDP-glucose/GDP-mannose dehydrogenase family protein [Acidimicrobiia bacterium]|nr:UDP-glucose/GDP-mannose dehydrogenase family protein [Acidimicrobiia bacterium]